MDALRFKKTKVLCFVLLVGGIIHVWAQIINEISTRPYACRTSKYCSVCCNCKADICEGDCMVGYHGGRCKNRCPYNCITCKDHSDTDNYSGFANCTQCKDTYYVNEQWFQCQLSCPPGCKVCSSSVKCSECKPGYHGDTCDQVCPIECLDNNCGKETGFCELCKENLNGSKCDVCATGKFGLNCSSDCNKNCQGKVCNMTSGDCFSCTVGKYGQKCDSTCPDNCLGRNCSMESGECRSCKDGYFGGRCNISCPKHCNESTCLQTDGSCKSCQRQYFGISCNETCPERCLNDVCNILNGSCVEGCDDNFEGHDCKDCLPGWFGDDCNTTCSKGCLNETCDQLSGICEECKENFNGTYCLECKNGMTGDSCNQSCSSTCLANQCDRLYANCTLGCIENFDGPFCNKCLAGKHGIYENCSNDCSTSCRNLTCNMDDGVCHEECLEGFSGETCNEILKASSSAISELLSPLQISIVAVSAVLAAILFVVLTSWVLHRKRLSKHKARIEDSVNLMPNESNNDVAPVVEKSEPRMAHDYVNVVLDQTGHEQLDDASNQDRPSDIDVQANGRINEDLEVTGDIPIRSVGNDRITASKVVTLSETERCDTLTAEGKATMSQIEPIAFSRPLPSLTTRESESSVTIMTKEYAANVLNAKQSKSAALDNSQMRFLDQNERQFRKQTFTKREIKSQNLELRDRSRKPNPPQTNLVKDQNLRAFSALYTNHTQRNDGSISLVGLAEYVRSRDEDFYQEEFGKFPKGLLKSYNDATKPENMGKNRYNGIYPYDETRVKLEGPGSDYINASFVNGYKKKRQFIAALGPIKKATENFKTFWLMIWQQKVEKIVMVTNLREQGSMKCEKYWPDKGDSIMYGQVKVTCTNIQEYSEFVIRTFIIEKDRECHLLLHYHFTAWPDKAAPEEVTSIIDLRHIVNATKPIWKGPVVVHCSAGIGRTGTYIALDYLTEQGRAEGYLDVFRCVCDLRQQRTSMVQKWEQYRYIHQALVQSLLLDSDPVALEGFMDYAADEQRLAMVFKRQDLLIETPDDDEKEALTRNESLVHLNREGADIPGDLHRVRLYLHRSHGDCDYINAVYVDSFLKKNQYIIAQTPLRATVKDFLMMVVQERCPCIVSLEDIRPDQNVGIFVPRDNKSRLSIAPELGVSCSDVIETDAYVKKVLTISTSPNTGSSIHTVSHFRFKGWKDSDDAPSRVTEFIELVEDVADTVQEGDGPIIVHCLNGGGRSGLFCLVSTLLEKLDSVREISVVNAIRRVRYRRPVGIQSLGQFLFCYRALSEYLRITPKTASMSFDSTEEEPLSKISRQSRIILAGNMAAMLDEPDEHVYGNLTF